MRKYPDWCYTARHKMIDRDMTMTDLANAIGIGRTTVSSVLNGKAVSIKCIKAISDYLNIPDNYDLTVSEKPDGQ